MIRFCWETRQRKEELFIACLSIDQEELGIRNYLIDLWFLVLLFFEPAIKVLCCNSNQFS